jgi:hypothetical protein
MKKFTPLCTFALLTATIAFAQSGTPSSKATAAINTAVGCTYSGVSNIGGILPASCHDIFSGAAVDVTPDSFAQIMKTTVKVSNSQSLFVSPTLVTGLYTNTTTKTKTGSTSTAVASGGVYMRAVLYDSSGNVYAQGYPGAVCNNEILGCYAPAGSGSYGVVLDSRVQTLSQTLSACVVNVGTTTGTCSFDSTIQLILQTTSAHGYNYIFPNVGVGVYTLAIEVGVDSNATISGYGTAIGAAAYGLGSVTVESVRMVHDFSF